MSNPLNAIIYFSCSNICEISIALYTIHITKIGTRTKLVNPTNQAIKPKKNSRQKNSIYCMCVCVKKKLDHKYAIFLMYLG